MSKRFSASSAAQLMQCHGSANLELAIPGYVEPKRDDMAGAKGVGTRMHDSFRAVAHWDLLELESMKELVEHYQDMHWRKRRKLLGSDTTDSEREDWVLTILPGALQGEAEKYMAWLMELDLEERLPPQMLLYVSETLGALMGIRSRYNPDFYELIEERSIECDWLPSHPLTTPDVVFATKRVLVVIDYKTGKIPVSPVDNDQLMFYAVSALYAYYQRELWYKIDKVVLVIWQPGNHDEWETTVDHLLQWRELALEADLSIIGKDLTLRPGTYCTFCPANPHSRGDKAPPYCPAQMSLLYPSNTDEEAVLDL